MGDGIFDPEVADQKSRAVMTYRRKLDCFLELERRRLTSLSTTLYCSGRFVFSVSFSIHDWIHSWSLVSYIIFEAFTFLP